MQVNPHSQALALLDLDAVRGALGPAGADVAAAQAETKRQLEAQLQVSCARAAVARVGADDEKKGNAAHALPGAR